MATSYPTGLDSYTDKVDGPAGDDVVAAHVNNIQDGQEALQTKLAIDGNPILNTSGLDSSGDTPSAKHLTLTPGTDKFVKIAVLDQEDTTDGYNNNTVILTGWGAIAGAASESVSEAVSFGITFDAIPRVVCSFTGRNDTADSFPPDEAATDIAGGSAVVPSTSGFTAVVHNYAGVNLSATKKYYYTWIAIGELA